MILLWLISFSLLAPVLGGATINGVVELKDSKNPKVVKGKDAGGVAVWVTPKDPATKGAASREQVLQKNKRFEPHLLPVFVGSTVDFPNLDPIFHNAFSNFDGKVFDLGLYPPGQSRGVRFDRPGIVRLFCNIHATMSAVIVVLSTPYFTISKPDGRWEIKDLPLGDYTLSAFHERSTPTVLKALDRPIRLTTTNLSIATLVISESGYGEKPHPNKFGLAYPPSEANPIYPGAKR